MIFQLLVVFGPTRDERQKPDVVAPGQAIISCTSGDASEDASSAIDSYYHMNQGTSMSSPICAGAVALMLDYNASLTAVQVKANIISSVVSDNYTGGSLPNNIWGYGKLNVFNTISNMYTSTTTNFNDLLFYDGWSGDGSTSVSSGTKIAVKFTPSNSGDVTGAFFHPSSTVNLTGPLYFEIWSDDGSGLPNTKLGLTVSLNFAEILKYSWNYVNLTNSGVHVSSGTNYHLVVYYNSGTGLFVRIDNGAIDGRSSQNTGSGWSPFACGDYRLRPKVSSSQSSLPVELVSFSGKAAKNSVNLNWSTATEVNNYGFEIETSIPLRSQWTNIGFVEGHGNSNSMKSYSFADNSAEGGILKYRLKQIDTDGSSEYSDVVEIVFDKAYKYSLEQNHPNPFNPTTKLNYTIKNNSKVVIEVYNTLGQKVVELFSGTQNTGKHSVSWNATGLSSGTYFARFSATSLQNNERYTEVKKLLLIK